MNKKNGFKTSIMIAGMGLAVTAQAQQWPQGEQAYMPSTQSPQWVDLNHAPQAPQMQLNRMPAQPMPYQQPNMPYPAPNYGYAPPYGYQNFYAPRAPYRGNTGWGSWPNFNSNNWMPGMNMGNWSMPNMDMGNWSTPDMPNFGNMPGMPNMDNFSMPSPSFEMPSPSFTTPSMPMPFNY